jgi:hypothetical protein
LWDIEDDIRDKERAGEFDGEFIRLARAVYVTNDERAAIKKRINLMLGSALVEEKSYKDYKPGTLIAAVANSRSHCTVARHRSYASGVFGAAVGHFTAPVSSIGRYTRGCEFHRYMPGIGQDNGRSAAVTS